MPSRKDKPKDAKDFEAWFENWFDRKRFSDATAEMKKNTQSTLSAFANKFDLVSRDEFNNLQGMLETAVKRLEKIEARLDGGKAGSKKKPAKKAAGKKKPASKAAKKK